MSFLAKLYVEGAEFTLLDCAFEIHKEVDETCHPSTRAKAGKIMMTLQVRGRDKIFAQWVASDTMTKDGRIVFFKDNALAVMDEIKFNTSYCINYGLEFHSENGLIANIVIAAHKITYGGATHTNLWGI